MVALNSLYTVAAFLTAIPTTLGHMQMLIPSPLRDPTSNRKKEPKDYNILTPLHADGSDFACKGYQYNTPWTTVATYQPGETYQMKLKGGATHGGGSCQLSLSCDGGERFKVLKSIIGGCPEDMEYGFTIPVELEDALGGMKTTCLFAWTWFNKFGNREMYMNCAVVDIEPKAMRKAVKPIGKQDSKNKSESSGKKNTNSNSKSKDKSDRDIHQGHGRRTTVITNARAQAALSSYPDLFVANLAGINNCKTKETVNIVFGDPGRDVTYEDNETSSAKPSYKGGECTGKGSENAGSSDSSSLSSSGSSGPWDSSSSSSSSSSSGDDGQWHGADSTSNSDSSQSSQSDVAAKVSDGQWHPELYGEAGKQQSKDDSSQKGTDMDMDMSDYSHDDSQHSQQQQSSNTKDSSSDKDTDQSDLDPVDIDGKDQKPNGQVKQELDAYLSSLYGDKSSKEAVARNIVATSNTMEDPANEDVTDALGDNTDYDTVDQSEDASQNAMEEAQALDSHSVTDDVVDMDSTAGINDYTDMSSMTDMNGQMDMDDSGMDSQSDMNDPFSMESQSDTDGSSSMESSMDMNEQNDMDTSSFSDDQTDPEAKDDGHDAEEFYLNDPDLLPLYSDYVNRLETSSNKHKKRDEIADALSADFPPADVMAQKQVPDTSFMALLERLNSLGSSVFTLVKYASKYLDSPPPKDRDPIGVEAPPNATDVKAMPEPIIAETPARPVDEDTHAQPELIVTEPEDGDSVPETDSTTHMPVPIVKSPGFRPPKANKTMIYKAILPASAKSVSDKIDELSQQTKQAMMFRSKMRRNMAVAGNNAQLLKDTKLESLVERLLMLEMEAQDLVHHVISIQPKKVVNMIRRKVEKFDVTKEIKMDQMVQPCAGDMKKGSMKKNPMNERAESDTSAPGLFESSVFDKIFSILESIDTKLGQIVSLAKGVANKVGSSKRAISSAFKKARQMAPFFDPNAPGSASLLAGLMGGPMSGMGGGPDAGDGVPDGETAGNWWPEMAANGGSDDAYPTGPPPAGYDWSKIYPDGDGIGTSTPSLYPTPVPNGQPHFDGEPDYATPDGQSGGVEAEPVAIPSPVNDIYKPSSVPARGPKPEYPHENINLDPGKSGKQPWSAENANLNGNGTLITGEEEEPKATEIPSPGDDADGNQLDDADDDQPDDGGDDQPDVGDDTQIDEFAAESAPERPPSPDATSTDAPEPTTEATSDGSAIPTSSEEPAPTTSEEAAPIDAPPQVESVDDQSQPPQDQGAPEPAPEQAPVPQEPAPQDQPADAQADGGPETLGSALKAAIPDLIGTPDPNNAESTGQWSNSKRQKTTPSISSHFDLNAWFPYLLGPGPVKPPTVDDKDWPSQTKPVDNLESIPALVNDLTDKDAEDVKKFFDDLKKEMDDKKPGNKKNAPRMHARQFLTAAVVKSVPLVLPLSIPSLVAFPTAIVNPLVLPYSIPSLVAFPTAIAKLPEVHVLTPSPTLPKLPGLLIFPAVIPPPVISAILEPPTIPKPPALSELLSVPSPLSKLPPPILASPIAQLLDQLPPLPVLSSILSEPSPLSNLPPPNLASILPEVLDQLPPLPALSTFIPSSPLASPIAQILDTLPPLPIVSSLLPLPLPTLPKPGNSGIVPPSLRVPGVISPLEAPPQPTLTLPTKARCLEKEKVLQVLVSSLPEVLTKDCGSAENPDRTFRPYYLKQVQECQQNQVDLVQSVQGAQAGLAKECTEYLA